MTNSARGSLLRNHAFVAELVLLVGMAATLLVPSSFDNIRPWYEISIPLYVRAAFWIAGLATLPGLYILRIGALLQAQNQTIRFALSSILSFAAVGSLTLIYYSIAGSLAYFPPVLMIVLALLAISSWRFGGIPSLTLPKALTRSQYILLAAVLAAVVTATVVELNWRYLIYTDFWTSLFPGVKIAFERDVYSAYLVTEYPVAYGYIIAGFSSGAGMPIVNTQALMLPLIALNALVFYALAKVVFAMSDRVASLGALIYVLGGGLGWVFHVFVTRGSLHFIPLSGVLKDMYFFPPFWNQIAFQYKLLALLLAISSLILFSLSGRAAAKGWKRQAALVVLSALLFVWSFLIHMLPAFLAPLFIGAVLFSGERKEYLRGLAALVVIGVALLFAHDLVMGGVYISLITEKIGPLISAISTIRLVLYGAISIVAVSLVVVGYYLSLYIRRRRKEAGKTRQQGESAGSLPAEPHPRWRYIKLLSVVALAIAYISGLFFVSMAQFNLDPSTPFPWFSYVTRYGFLGILALIGLATSRWDSNWLKMAAFWSVIYILLGSIWWGERINAFLFPVVSLLAAVGVVNVLKRAQPSISALRSTFSIKDLKLVGAAVAVVALLALSFGSLMVGVYWHATLPEQTDDSMAATFNWVGRNVPTNEAIITDASIHTMLFGIMHLTDHRIYDSAEVGNASGGIFAQMVDLEARNVRWVVTNGSVPSGSTELIRGLQYYGKLEFKAGSLSVKSLPQLKLPSGIGPVAVVDTGFLGLSQLNNRFFWADDRMDGWTVLNAQPIEDGEVLVLEWDFTSSTQMGPVAFTSVPQFSASAYPFIIIHYRNTALTTPSANLSVVQYVRIGASNINYSLSAPLPISDGYSQLFFRLPSNIVVNNVSIVMVNTGGLNGSLGLEVDYVGFSSSAPSYSSANPYFLSAAIPSIWPVPYTLYNDFEVDGGESILVTTYRYGANEKIANLTGIKVAVLISQVLIQPPWGSGWAPLSSGVMAGEYGGKRFLIVSASTQEAVNDLEGFADWLYRKVA